MSIVRSVDATMKNFNMTIDGKDILLDHIKQINVYSGLGIIGCPGDITMTFDMFKMIDKAGQKYNPIGKSIKFTIEDNKTGVREFDGIITSWRKVKNIKSSMVILSFERIEYVIAGKTRWWKTFKEKTILEIFKEFLDSLNMPITLDIYDESLLKKRGTWWEYFAIPQTMPTMQFLLDELAKDNILVYHNPKTHGICVASWRDCTNLNKLTAQYEDYVVDGMLAKFDANKTEWKNATFVFGKQIDSRAPWKIMEWQTSIAPDIWMDDDHDCWFYSSLKRPLHFSITDREVKPNDIKMPTQTEDYCGKDVSDDFEFSPEPSGYAAFTSNNALPEIRLGDAWRTTNANIYPRYMFYRMRESYVKNIRWIISDMLIAGSSKMVVPLTMVMVSQFENTMNENKDKLAPKDLWQSGLYAITNCQLIITGNNIMTKLKIRKPMSNNAAGNGGTNPVGDPNYG